MANRLQLDVRLAWLATMLVDVLAAADMASVRVKVEARVSPVRNHPRRAPSTPCGGVTLTIHVDNDGASVEETRELVDFLRRTLDPPFIVVREGDQVRIAYQPRAVNINAPT